MTPYIEIAQALVSAGYLSEVDIEAAADVLEDALIIADASNDYSALEDVVAEAEVWESEDAAIGDYESMEDDLTSQRYKRGVLF